VRNNVSQHVAYKENYRAESRGTAHNNQGHTEPDQFEDHAQGNFMPSPTSRFIDAAVRIPGINDTFTGTAPDLGAYESNTTPWKAGSTLTGDPTVKRQ
jgi:hypothetical protein